MLLFEPMSTSPMEGSRLHAKLIWDWILLSLRFVAVTVTSE